METKTVDGPQALVQLILPNEEKLKSYGGAVKPSVINFWYWRAKVFYDPNVCGCKKKNMNAQIIEQSYTNLLNLPEEEKQVVRELCGGNITLILNGVTLGTI